MNGQNLISYNYFRSCFAVEVSQNLSADFYVWAERKNDRKETIILTENTQLIKFICQYMLSDKFERFKTFKSKIKAIMYTLEWLFLDYNHSWGNWDTRKGVKKYMLKKCVVLAPKLFPKTKELLEYIPS